MTDMPQCDFKLPDGRQCQQDVWHHEGHHFEILPPERTYTAAEVAELKDQVRHAEQMVKESFAEAEMVLGKRYKAQCAAMLEKAVLIASSAWIESSVKPESFHVIASNLASEIRALIPTDHAAALAERIRYVKSMTWEHVFQGIEEPCGCENHRKLSAALTEVKRLARLEGVEELKQAIIEYLDNRPDDEQGTTKEHAAFQPIARKLENLLEVEEARWGN